MRLTPVTGVGHPGSETVLCPALESIFSELAEQWESADRLVPGRADEEWTDPRPPLPLARPLTSPRTSAAASPPCSRGCRTGTVVGPRSDSPTTLGPHGTAPTARRPRPPGKIRDLGAGETDTGSDTARESAPRTAQGPAWRSGLVRLGPGRLRSPPRRRSTRTCRARTSAFVVASGERGPEPGCRSVRARLLDSVSSGPEGQGREGSREAVDRSAAVGPVNATPLVCGWWQRSYRHPE